MGVLAAGVLFGERPARASGTLGTITGVVHDQATGKPVAGVTVVATAAVMPTGVTAATDSSGSYLLTSLLPGNYTVTAYFSKSMTQHQNVLVGADKTVTVNLKISISVAETNIIKEKTPAIDTTSTKVGLTVNEDFANYLPLPRDIGAMASFAPGAAPDDVGLSIAGATGFENTFIIDGNDTTDVVLGGQGTSLPPEFTESVETITGAYNAEFGHATGGIVNAVTKSGTNQFHGEVFGNFRPYEAPVNIIPTNGSAISSTDGLNWGAEPGFDVSGPIVKDKLFFFVGFAPLFDSFNFHRQFSSLIDNCNNATGVCGVNGKDPLTGLASGDGVPDKGADGFTLQAPISSLDRTHYFTTYYFATKINYEMDADNTGSLSWYGNPETDDGWLAAEGNDSAEHYNRQTGSQDVSLRWTSKLFDRKMQIDAQLGMHYEQRNTAPFSDAGNTVSRFYAPIVGQLWSGSQGFMGQAPMTLYDFYNADSSHSLVDGQAIDAGMGHTCVDGSANDWYPLIANCPLLGYATGGLGFYDDITTNRYSERLSATHFFRLLGHHQLKYGIDFQQTLFDHTVGYTGGEQDVFGYQGIAGQGATASFAHYDPTKNPPLSPTRNYEDTVAGIDWGYYLQDSYSPIPNVTVNAGVRWEQFSIYGARLAQLKTDTSQTPAIGMPGEFAPRIGVIWDPTSEGKAKVYAHYGRYYENIPLDIADREFSGQTQVTTLYTISPGSCKGAMNPPFDINLRNCPSMPGMGQPAGYAMTLPGLRPESQDEEVAGGQYEVSEDFVVGAYGTHRQLNDIVEDVTDGHFDSNGSLTYFLANPGDWPSRNALIAQYNQIMSQVNNTQYNQTVSQADWNYLAILNNQAGALKDFIDNYNTVKTMPNPMRDYDALTFTVDKAFSKSYYMTGSYTISRVYGNYPGSYDPFNGQTDPNISSEFDLPSLMYNRVGLLPNNLTHNFKLAGYYRLDLGRADGYFGFGADVSYTTGNPQTVLGSSPYPGYGANEVFLLPNGQYGNTPSLFTVDGQITYGHRVGKYDIQGYLGADNLFDMQTNYKFQTLYSAESTLPIIGGDTADLAHAKQYAPQPYSPGMAGEPTYDNLHPEIRADQTSLGLNPIPGAPFMSARLLDKLPTFGQPVLRLAPLVIRCGFRVNF